MPKKNNTVIGKVMSERSQNHESRKFLFDLIEKDLGKPIVSFFTSFSFPVGIEDNDADIIAGLLPMMDLKNGLALVISSPGGNGLAAERIINICKTFSVTKAFTVIVPGKAKSAATILSFGSEKILMGPTSELGPVDPQLPIEGDKGIEWVSVHHIVESYKELFSSAIKEKGNLEPYIQQLRKPYYDASIIKKYESLINLTDDISIRALQSCMMKGKKEVDIKKDLEIFLNPAHTKTHGRPIFYDEAKKCGLNVDIIDVKSNLWKNIYELYIRTNDFVSKNASKTIENKETAFHASIPKQ